MSRKLTLLKLMSHADRTTRATWDGLIWQNASPESEAGVLT
jgi:hypothetical protein